MGDLTPGRKQILLYLMNQKGYASPADIFNDERPVGMHHPNSVLKAIKEMKDQKLVELENVGSKKRTSYRCSIPAAQETFLALAKEFHKSDFLPFYSQQQFSESKYAREMVNSKLVDYVQERLKTNWGEARKANVLKILKASPSALYAALFSKPVTQPSEEIMSQIDDAERARLKDLNNDNALMLLLSNFVSDYQSGQIVKIENVQTCGAIVGIFLDSRKELGVSDYGNILKLSTKSIGHPFPISVPRELVQFAIAERPKHKKEKREAPRYITSPTPSRIKTLRRMTKEMEAWQKEGYKVRKVGKKSTRLSKAGPNARKRKRK